MMNLILIIITNIVSVLLLFLRSITMIRICIELFFSRKLIQRKMVCLLGADAIGVRIVNVTEPPQNERFVNQDQL
jgi:hypothetical protein